VDVKQGVAMDIRVVYTNTPSKERYDEGPEKAEAQPALMRGVVRAFSVCAPSSR
jgi:hypothetical protein